MIKEMKKMKVEEFQKRLSSVNNLLTELWDDASFYGIDGVSYEKMNDLDTDFRKTIELLQWYEDIKK